MPAKQVFPLSKLTEAIENVINQYCSKVVWVKAEIVKLNHYPHTGHCYPDLVEKKDGKIVAELRGNIWKSNFDLINEKFRNVLQEDLKDDMTVVVQATVTYHSVYGLALNILDIDPEYTLGELAKQKAEAIKKLIADGLFEANKQQQLPRLPKTIAVISINSSKGYQDFVNVIETNPRGYKFHYKLFPAILQGDRAVSTITTQLKRIKKHKKLFDAVAIIRGGGGEISLSCYDSYELAREIAAFPLPVLTGIGHSTNETVSELVSYRSFITPTKIAEYLIEEFDHFAQPLRENLQKIKAGANILFERQETQLQRISSSFGFLAQRVVDKEKHKIFSYSQKITSEAKNLLKKEASEIKNTETSVELLSPRNILKRGFSIVRKDGKAVSSAAILKKGDTVEIEFYKGKASAEIKNNKLR